MIKILSFILCLERWFTYKTWMASAACEAGHWRRNRWEETSQDRRHWEWLSWTWWGWSKRVFDTVWCLFLPFWAHLTFSVVICVPQEQFDPHKCAFCKHSEERLSFQTFLHFFCTLPRSPLTWDRFCILFLVCTFRHLDHMDSHPYDTLVFFASFASCPTSN